MSFEFTGHHKDISSFCHLDNDTSTAKEMLPEQDFRLWHAFCCSQQKLISTFGKERLNNIWQAQVLPRSVQPSLPQWEGNLAVPSEAVPTLTGMIHSLSLVPDEYHGVVFEYTDFMQKELQDRPHASLPMIDDYWGLWETWRITCVFLNKGMHKSIKYMWYGFTTVVYKIAICPYMHSKLCNTLMNRTRPLITCMSGALIKPWHSVFDGLMEKLTKHYTTNVRHS